MLLMLFVYYGQKEINIHLKHLSMKFNLYYLYQPLLLIYFFMLKLDFIKKEI